MLTQARLRELLDYDPATGQFRWRVTLGSRACAGNLVGRPNDQGYISIRVDRKLYQAHRLAWLYMTGSFPTETIDHRDLNRANNAFRNLRLATKAQQMANLPLQRRSKSGAKGVQIKGQKYKVKIRMNGKQKYLGTFSTLDAAKAAYAAAASDQWGEFSRVE